MVSVKWKIYIKLSQTIVTSGSMSSGLVLKIRQSWIDLYDNNCISSTVVIGWLTVLCFLGYICEFFWYIVLN